MKIKLDNTNHVTAYATIGDIEDGVEYKGIVPEGFLKSEHSESYLLVNDVLQLDPNYVAPEPIPVAPTTPDPLQSILMQQSIRIAQIEKALEEKGVK